MSMPPSLRRFWIRLSADRRRFGLLVGAVCVGLLLWGRLIVVRQPPRMALADPNQAKATGPRDNIAQPRGTDNLPGAGVGSAEPRGKRSLIAVELWSSPNQDPFVISPHYFPKPTLIPPPIEIDPKSDGKPAEDFATIQARKDAQIRATMDRMKLEAALAGNMAVISDKKYRVGEVIVSPAGSMFEFKLVEVRQRSVMLECEGRQFELLMATPGS
jgi:hypothetical protein